MSSGSAVAVVRDSGTVDVQTGAGARLSTVTTETVAGGFVVVFFLNKCGGAVFRGRLVEVVVVVVVVIIVVVVRVLP